MADNKYMITHLERLELPLTLLCININGFKYVTQDLLQMHSGQVKFKMILGHSKLPIVLGTQHN